MTSGERRQSYLLRAARAAFLAGDLPGAESLLHEAGPDIADANYADWAEVQALFYLNQDRARQALGILDGVERTRSVAQGARLLQLRARAQFSLGLVDEAVATLVKRETWLDTREDLTANQQMIWRGMMTAGRKLPRPGQPLPEDPVVAGWLELGQIGWEFRNDPLTRDLRLADWRGLNPEHPASGLLLVDMLGEPGTGSGWPRRVALLLPLSGRQQDSAAAVRDGFMAAHFAAGIEISVTVFDTSAGASDAYRRALASGADLVVGPLIKQEVEQLQPRAGQVTTVALNYPSDGDAPAGFYQFGLAPEDEARTVARRALAQGETRAVALAPNNDWGRRTLSSFVQELEMGGGVLLEYRFFDPAAPDFSVPIQNLLKLTESQARHRALSDSLGVELSFEPRRREDVDFLFLAASAKAGRLIRPQLRYHFAGDLPTYATSSIYEPGGRNNSDLNGLSYAEMPWVLSSFSDAETVLEFWPERGKRRARLYALGYDAYQLMPYLNGQARYPGLALNGVTGRLSSDNTGRIYRELEWADIRNGRARAAEPLPGAGADGFPMGDLGTGMAAPTGPGAGDTELSLQER